MLLYCNVDLVVLYCIVLNYIILYLLRCVVQCGAVMRYAVFCDVELLCCVGCTCIAGIMLCCIVLCGVVTRCAVLY